MKQQDGYIRSLDGVRAIAILLVMTFHGEITRFGWMGVQLFFVLSGFLITGILWKEKFREQKLSFKFKKFWFRRTLRIFPLYFAYLILLGISFALFHFPSYYAGFAPYLFTYTFNYTRLLEDWQGNPLFTHLWSLAVEEQFYLIYPFLILLLPVRAIRFLLPAVILLSPLSRYLLGEYYMNQGASLAVAADAVYWNTLSHLDAFFLGGSIHVFSLDKKLTRPKALLFWSFFMVVAAGIANFTGTPYAAEYLLDFGYPHETPSSHQHVWQYSILNLFFASFILFLITARAGSEPVLKKIMEANWLVRIGRVSYGMYIFHWLVYVYVFKRLMPEDSLLWKTLLFLPYVIAVYLMAELSYNLFEKRFLQLKDKLSYPAPGSTVQRSALAEK